MIEELLDNLLDSADSIEDAVVYDDMSNDYFSSDAEDEFTSDTINGLVSNDNDENYIMSEDIVNTDSDFTLSSETETLHDDFESFGNHTEMENHTVFFNNEDSPNGWPYIKSSDFDGCVDHESFIDQESGLIDGDNNDTFQEAKHSEISFKGQSKSAKEWEDWHTKRANDAFDKERKEYDAAAKAADRGDATAAKSHRESAKSWHNTGTDHMSRAKVWKG